MSVVAGIENVYRLTPSGKVEVGVRPTDKDGFRYSIPGHKDRKVVLVPFSRVSAPRLSTEGLLVEGGSMMVGGKPFITSRCGWQGALLYVDVKDLCFSPDVGAHFDISNTYPGVTYGCWFQCGDRRSKEQIQWASFPKDISSIIVADTSGIDVRYIKICWYFGKMKVEKPSAQDMGRMLVERAKAIKQTHKMLLWTLENLKRIGVGHLWPRELVRALEALSK